MAWFREPLLPDLDNSSPDGEDVPQADTDLEGVWMIIHHHIDQWVTEMRKQLKDGGLIARC